MKDERPKILGLWCPFAFADIGDGDCSGGHCAWWMGDTCVVVKIAKLLGATFEPTNVLMTEKEEKRIQEQIDKEKEAWGRE